MDLSKPVSISISREAGASTLAAEVVGPKVSWLGRSVRRWIDTAASDELDEAVAVTQALIASDPDDTLAHTSLSILYQQQGKVPEAEAAALRAKLLGWKQQLRQEPAVEGKK